MGGIPVTRLWQWLTECPHRNVTRIFNNTQVCLQCGMVRGYWLGTPAGMEPLIGRWCVQRERDAALLAVGRGIAPSERQRARRRIVEQVWPMQAAEVEYPVGWSDDCERILQAGLPDVPPVAAPKLRVVSRRPQ